MKALENTVRLRLCRGHGIGREAKGCASVGSAAPNVLEEQEGTAPRCSLSQMPALHGVTAASHYAGC